MSRIFEALQRADLERKSGQVPEVESFPEPEVVSRAEVLSQASTGLDLDKIACYPWKPSVPSTPSLGDRGATVEQFRKLRSRVRQARSEAPLKTILISSGMPSEGKSFVALNLAMSLARNGINNVVLIDGDLRRPTLHSLLGAPNRPGLSEYLGGTAELSDILQRDKSSKAVGAAKIGSVSNLTFIPSGKCSENSSELVTNGRIAELIATLSLHFDWILIDSSPVLTVTDAVDLARAADAVLLVAREARTPYEVAQRTQAAFSKSRILGFVLNAAKHIPHQEYYAAYYYGGEDEGTHAQREENVRRKG
ncbi:MAG TPA: CpsD/CapB family tyrosine-protein kinase [Acidobacteriaceae bacterium]|nr:CpsD/CapB family tyrosine-protein kinase [Acidobacteriaceae bacterium]